MHPTLLGTEGRPYSRNAVFPEELWGKKWQPVTLSPNLLTFRWNSSKALEWQHTMPISVVLAKLLTIGFDTHSGLTFPGSLAAQGYGFQHPVIVRLLSMSWCPWGSGEEPKPWEQLPSMQPKHRDAQRSTSSLWWLQSKTWTLNIHIPCFLVLLR